MYRLLACSGSVRKAVNGESDDFLIRTNHSSSAESHSSPHLFLSYISGHWKYADTILWSLSAVMNIHYSYSSEDAEFGPLNPSLRFSPERPPPILPYISQSQLSEVDWLSSIRPILRPRGAKIKIKNPADVVESWKLALKSNIFQKQRSIPTTAMPSFSSPDT